MRFALLCCAVPMPCRDVMCSAMLVLVIAYDCLQMELQRLVRALDKAGKDPRVKGLLAYVGPRDQLEGLAQVSKARTRLCCRVLV